MALERLTRYGASQYDAGFKVNSNKCKKNCSLYTSYDGEMTHRKQQK